MVQIELWWASAVTRLTRDQLTCDELMQELWAPVVGWEGLYEVSDLGRVKSLARQVTQRAGVVASVRERILRPGTDSSGYLQVCLHKNGDSRMWLVHHLVTRAFIGPRPEGLEVRHGKNGKLDNSLANLCYGTHKQNCEDRIRDGVSGRGETHPKNRITAEQVREARRLVATGPKGTLTRLAKEWGLTQQALGQAVKGITWSWLT
jgi:hypothetical protein